MRFEIANRNDISKCPKAIIFDTDNTLYPYDNAHKRATDAAERKACQLLGVSKEEFKKVFRTAREEVKSQLGETASSHSRLLYFQRSIEMLGMKTQLLITLDVEQTYWRTFLNEAKLFNGVRPFILDLKSAGIRTAIITDLTAQIQFRKIIYFGLDDYFDFVVTSEESGADKPSKKPFEMALKKLGVAPTDTWMIGDNPIADNQGARENGITAIQKVHPGVEHFKEGPAAADIWFEDFGRLQKFFLEQGWIEQ